MPRNERQGEIFEHLVLLRDCYPLRSGYDRDPGHQHPVGDHLRRAAPGPLPGG